MTIANCGLICYICDMKHLRTIFFAVAIVFVVMFMAACQGADANSGADDSIVVPKPVTTDTVRLIFGGDLMQHIPQINAARKAGGGFDYTRSFQYVAPIFRDADIAVINLETTLTTRGDYSGYPRFAAPVELADAMVDMGIDIVLLANNHCCDRGARGIDTTIEQLSARGVAHTGAFTGDEDRSQNNVIYFECKGVRFALINYTYGTNGLPVPQGKRVNIIDKDRIISDISTINRDSVDCLIACMHWGIEYQRHPNAEQKNLAQLLKLHGVDVIIGSHPHVVQRYEQSEDGVVFYSLGNFVSNQRKRYTNGGLIAEVNIVRCDTVPQLQYSANAHPAQVVMPGYRIVPKSVGDTLKMSSDARAVYNVFMRDTEQLLGVK